MSKHLTIWELKLALQKGRLLQLLMIILPPVIIDSKLNSKIKEMQGRNLG
jgi:hypothetical protein